MSFKRSFIILVLAVFTKHSHAQLLGNGDFLLGVLNWGCGIETNVETAYGGSNAFNPVAEIDALAGLCQTMTGLTIGQSYVVSMVASRRTGLCPSPAITNVNLTVSGGVLSTTITRTNTTFGMTPESFMFVANSTAHTITMAAGNGFLGSTCGMIVDNVSVTFSPLPIELLYFNGVLKNNNVEFSWSTASEKNNDHFEIEKSSDGIYFEKLILVPSQALNGNSNKKLTYESRGHSSEAGTTYYRLKQVDFDNTFSYSKLISVSAQEKIAASLYPNPNTGEFSVNLGNGGLNSISIINYLGETISTKLIQNSEKEFRISMEDKIPGFYYCILSGPASSQTFRFAVE